MSPNAFSSLGTGPLGAPLDIQSLRLAARGSKPRLWGLGSRQAGWPLYALDVSALDPMATPVVHLDSPFGTPDWDASAEGQHDEWVWSVPGSAGSRLWQRLGANAAAQALTTQDPVADFQRPRFARGARSAAFRVTTSATLGLAPVLAALSDPGSKPQRLAHPGPGRPLSGLFLQAATGSWLMVLQSVPGATPLERSSLAGDMQAAGHLIALPLDDKGAAAGPPERPLGDRLVHEFDGDVAGDGLAVLAISPGGLAFAVRDAQRAPVWAVHEKSAKASMYSPCLRAFDGRWGCALLLQEPASARQLMLGTLAP